MDTSNWMPNLPGGEPAMDTGDWRAQLPPDSRRRIVNRIMETLKRRLPFSGQEGLQELAKIAVRFEEKIYSAAVNQQDYLRKISLKMLTMENNSQNSMPNPWQFDSPSNSNMPPDPAHLDSTDLTGHAIGADWQKEIYQKIKAMKETYLLELKEMHQKIAAKCQQNKSLPQPPKAEQLKLFKRTLEHLIAFLLVPKHDIVPNFKEKLDSYEQQIINIINSKEP